MFFLINLDFKIVIFNFDGNLNFILFNKLKNVVFVFCFIFLVKKNGLNRCYNKIFLKVKFFFIGLS